MENSIVSPSYIQTEMILAVRHLELGGSRLEVIVPDRFPPLPLFYEPFSLRNKCYFMRQYDDRTPFQMD